MTGIATPMMMLAFFSLSSLACQGQKPHKLLFKYDFFETQAQDPLTILKYDNPTTVLARVKDFFTRNFIKPMRLCWRDLMDETKGKKIIKFIMKGIMEK